MLCLDQTHPKCSSTTSQMLYKLFDIHPDESRSPVQEFIRVGYYVSNEYADEELRENPPEEPLLDKLTRVILAESPRVTRFPCEFDKPQPIPGANQGGEEAMEATLEPEPLDAGLSAQQQQQQQSLGADGWSSEQQESMEDTAMDEH